MYEMLWVTCKFNNLHNRRFVNFLVKEIATFHPQMDRSESDLLYTGWKKAVKAAMAFK